MDIAKPFIDLNSRAVKGVVRFVADICAAQQNRYSLAMGKLRSGENIAIPVQVRLSMANLNTAEQHALSNALWRNDDAALGAIVRKNLENYRDKIASEIAGITE